MKRKGIILAGGSGSRLYPLTQCISKQLLPVYDKPMIYYPLSVLMLADIREIVIITTERDLEQFKSLLGTGAQWGVNLSYATQSRPEGLAQAYLISEKFLDDAPSALILGDNIFFGHDLPSILRNANKQTSGCSIFGYHVADPERYGVVAFDENNNVAAIEEKPEVAPSNYAVTGLYFADETVVEKAKSVEFSGRGELEITDVLNMYLTEGTLHFNRLGRGNAWLDTGTTDALLNANNYVRTITDRQGLLVGSPDEVAFTKSWIGREQLAKTAHKLIKSSYGRLLMQILKDKS